MNSAVIFDLDGTLWDSTGRACEIWNHVLERHNDIPLRMTKELSAQLMGRTMEEIGSILFPDLNPEAQTAIMDEIAGEEVDYLSKNGAILYEGVEDTLKKLALTSRLYIVSNSQDGYVQSFLQAHNLAHCFSDIEMSGRTGCDKGTNIKMLMARNHIESAVYIGDTQGDEIAARHAGIPFIHAQYGFGKAVSPDAAIASIKELPQCLQKVLKTYESQTP